MGSDPLEGDPLEASLDGEGQPPFQTQALKDVIVHAIYHTTTPTQDFVIRWCGPVVAWLWLTQVSWSEGLQPLPQPLTRLPAGTTVVDQPSGYWNRLVLLARPRIASGDIDALPTSVRDSISTFSLTIMASVQQTAGSAPRSNFALTDVGIGYSALVRGQLTVVTVAQAHEVGLKLGLFDRMTLAENEKQLDTARIIARTPTLVMIDAPAFVLRGTEHQSYIMRHFIWVEPHTGRNAAMVWLVRREPSGTMQVDIAEPARWSSAGMREDRAIHVDGQQFNFLGIPNERAFALEQLPPGTPVVWTAEAQNWAGLPEYDVDSLRNLTAALNAMMRPTTP